MSLNANNQLLVQFIIPQGFYEIEPETGDVTVDDVGDGNYVDFEPEGRHFVDVFQWLFENHSKELINLITDSLRERRPTGHTPREIVALAVACAKERARTKYVGERKDDVSSDNKIP